MGEAHIRLASPRARGSPAAEDCPARAKRRAELVPEKSGSSRAREDELTPIRVLVCDDASSVRVLLGVIFDIHPRIEVVAEAADGREAIEQASRHQPDVVLLDLAMPVMDGLDALPAIREAAPDARIIVFSGFTEGGMAGRALALGASGYLEKGAEPETITALIESTADAA